MNATQLSLYDSQIVGAPHNGTPTSIAAAQAATVKVTPQSRRILWYLAAVSATQPELSRAMFLPRSTICARCRQLEIDGLARKTGKVRPSEYGRPSAEYAIRAKGREYLDRLAK